ncbi:MAG TPA: CoA-binding protein [Thermodesulfobacteriota bacterium]|nr:CoA-binding protein [Thermodesulfobacteriota bacterium]
MWSIREILESKSVAVVGASRDPEKPGAQLLKALRRVGYQGRVAGVNPQGGQVFETHLYRSLEEVPFPVDLAVLHIPPRLVAEALKECGRKGVKGVVISAEGFAEAGPEGAKYQEEVRDILRSTGMRGFGPNTLGLVNTENGLTTSYFATPRMMRPGTIGFAAQSGIFIGALLRYLSSFEGCQLSKGIGLGNKVDVDESDALSYLVDDEQTEIIGMYLEDVRNGRRFLETVRKAVAKKPVLMIKGGRTQEGSRAMASHTASMAGEDAVFEGAMRQAGVLRMTEVDDFVRTLKGFLNMPLPQGGRLAFVTYSGAQAIMSIDAAVERGLKVARLGETTLRKISRVIATPSKTRNPVDLFPDMLAHGFEKTSMEILKALLEDDGVDGIIWISFANMGPEIYQPMADLLVQQRPKPVFFSLLGAKKDIEACEDFLERKRLPCYDFPEHAVRVFAHMWRYSKRRRRN